MAGERFRDSFATLADLADECLVACPQCGACARVAPADPQRRDLHAARRLTCAACGLVRESPVGAAALGEPRDPHLGLPLWLQAPVGDDLLWAYNLRHLDLIERYVRATLRERRRDAGGWRNSSALSRLPAWAKAAGSRPEILRAIARMRARR